MTNYAEEEDIIIEPYMNQHDIVGAELFGVKRGDRIRLEHTKDSFTKLKPGALGTVQEFWTDDLRGRRWSSCLAHACKVGYRRFKPESIA